MRTTGTRPHPRPVRVALLVALAGLFACSSSTEPNVPGGNGGINDVKFDFTPEEVGPSDPLPDFAAVGMDSRINIQGGVDDEHPCYLIGANLVANGSDLRMTVDVRQSEGCDTPVGKYAYHAVISFVPAGDYRFRLIHVSSTEESETILDQEVHVD